MATNLSKKEELLLKDQKSHEEVCIEKYTNYAEQAQDPELKQLFNQYLSQEEQHLNTLNQIMSGQVPNLQAQQGGQSGQQGQQGQQSGQNQNSQQSGQNQQYGMQSSKSTGMVEQSDIELCKDVLMTEKYVSNTYDTAIFEFRDTNIRNALNHIQKEEQQHGEGVFNYMYSKGMYNVE
ncbi:spore coat protein [Paratissierella segnis]|uniref:Spore coat protein n=1 Tax=Paratissierella segnis TaxID=2763679 RepID=A0A926ES16_9FIRM|nr:spore coat protein [Paratissierella segnis]MBC8587816.1 spore coat protein [Paratissierella segnis]